MKILWLLLLILVLCPTAARPQSQANVKALVGGTLIEVQSKSGGPSGDWRRAER